MTEKKTDVESTVKNIRRKTRKKYSVEEKIRIVLEGLRGENNVAELCRKEGINQNLYYSWSKEFLEAGNFSLAANNQNTRLLSHPAVYKNIIPCSPLKQTKLPLVVPTTQHYISSRQLRPLWCCETQQPI